MASHHPHGQGDRSSCSERRNFFEGDEETDTASQVDDKTDTASEVDDEVNVVDLSSEGENDLVSSMDLLRRKLAMSSLPPSSSSSSFSLAKSMAKMEMTPPGKKMAKKSTPTTKTTPSKKPTPTKKLTPSKKSTPTSSSKKKRHQSEGGSGSGRKVSDDMV